jgi:heterodisulfide reductase subunit B
LKVTQEKIETGDLRKDVEEVIGSECPQEVKVLHILDVIVEKIGVDSIRERVLKSLNGLKVACYYGCLITRPPKVTGREQFENPTDMESVVEVLGARPVDWNMKTFCCGAGFALTQTDVALELMRKILADADSVGAEVISVGCPLCHVNLDSRQQKINEKFGTNFNIPVFYFTELMGLAFGIKAKELGVFKHLTKVKDFLEERALV